MDEESQIAIDPSAGRVLDNRYDVKNLLIEHAYHLSDPVDVSLENIRGLDRANLVRGVIDKLKTEWEPDITELQALTCVLVRDKAKAWSEYVSRGDQNVVFDESILPWPLEVDAQESPLQSKPWREFVPTDEDEDLFGDGLLHALRRSLWKAEDETKSQYAQYVYSNLKSFSRSYYPSIISELDFLATETLDNKSPSSLKAGIEMINFVRANVDYMSLPSYFDEENEEYLSQSGNSTDPRRIDVYDLNYASNGQFGSEIRHNITGLFLDNRDLMLRAIAQSPENERDLYLGEIIRFHGLSDTLNALRSLYFNPELREEKSALESVMRPFWSEVVGEGDFQPDLIAFYDTYGYVEYPLTSPETIKRKDMLKEKLPKLGIKKGAKIAEVACGTGLLTNEMSRDYDVVGVDINPNHIKIAQEKYPGRKFVVGNWYELTSIPEIEGADVVVIDGRSLPHVDELENLYKVLNECARLNVKALVYTFPDPNTGVLGERREKLLSVMERFKFNSEWLKNHFYNAVGRLGNNLGNRWLPPQDLLEEATEATGFRVNEVIRERNYDGNGTDNLVFICPFVEDKGRRVDMMLEANEKLKEREKTQELHPNPNNAYNHYLPEVWLYGYRKH